MKKNKNFRTAVVLCALILLIQAAMGSPEAYLAYRFPGLSYLLSGGDESVMVVRYEADSFVTDSPWNSASYILTLLALFLAPSTQIARFRILGKICGVLLLLSPEAILLGGIFGHRGFGCFTQLTWVIFAGLIVLGLCTLFVFRKKAEE